MVAELNILKIKITQLQVDAFCIYWQTLPSGDPLFQSKYKKYRFHTSSNWEFQSVQSFVEWDNGLGWKGPLKII